MRVVQLLFCWLGTAIPTSEGAEAPVEGASGGSPEGSINELVMVWESVRLKLFQTEIIEGWVKPLLRYTSYVMITSLRVEGQPQETKLLPLGLHVLHVYTCLKNGSGRVSLVVRNVSDSHIFLKKGRASGAGCVCITGATHGAVTRDGSHARHGIQTGTLVSGSKAGKVVGEIELGWVGPLVTREYSGSERASLSLS